MTELRSKWAAPLCLASVIAACSLGDRGPTPSDAPAPAANAAPTAPQAKVGAQLDIGDVMRRVHFAFRADGAAWAASDLTHSIRTTTLATTFTPRSSTGSPGAALTLQSADITRGGRALAMPTGASVDQEGHLVLARGAAHETLANEEAGLEQSWSFDAAPSTGGRDGGDICVRVRTSGEAFVGETAKGVHFADASTGIGVRYGNATWVDASGAKTAVAAHYEDGAIVMRVPKDVVDASTYPAVLDPVIGAEFGMDNPVVAAAPSIQQNPAIAFGGGTFLVVWEDFRSGTSASDIYGARVSPAGTVLDLSGIAFTANTGYNNTHPRVAYDGAANFLVVWADNRNFATTGFDIYGTRVVAATGALLDGTGVQITNTAVTEGQPALDFGGGSFLVTYTLVSAATSADIWAQRVSTTATLSGAPFLLSGAAGVGAPLEQTSSAVAYDTTSSEFLVVWQDARPTNVGIDIDAQLVPAAGAPTLANFVVDQTTAGNQTAPAVAWDAVDNDFLVTWTDQRNGGRIYANAVTPLGAVVGGAGDIQLVTAAAASESASSITYDPSCSVGTACFFVAYQDTRGANDIYGTRVFGNNGGVNSWSAIDPSGLSYTPSQPAASETAPAVATDGVNYFAVWTDVRSGAGNNDIYGGRIAKNGTLQDQNGILISTAHNQQTNTAAVYGGSGYLVVWQDLRNGTDTDIYGTRISFVPPNVGVVVDTAGIAISTAANNQSAPSVAFDGTNYVVVWDDARSGAGATDIYGARVTLGGVVSDPTGVAINTSANAQASPHLAFDGTNYFVVWQDARNGIGNADIYGTRVSTALAVLDGAGIPISAAANGQTSPRIAFDGTNYFIAWNDARAAIAIYGAQLQLSTLTVQPVNGIQISSQASSNAGRPGVSYDGSQMLVVWHDNRAGNFDIFGHLVTTATPPAVVGGVNSADITITNAANGQSAPVTAYDGTYHFVAWQDQRAGGNELDVYAARVSTAGVVVPLDGTGFPIANIQNDPERRPALATDRAGHVLVGYDRYDSSAAYGSVRARARFVQDLVNGAACNSALNGTDCASGFCTDGVCCNTACGNSASNDCQACSVAAGAPTNGTCAPVNLGVTCRAASGVCDNAATCDGVAITCPANGFKPNTTQCLAPLGLCDNGANCTGSSAACPADTFKPNTTVCAAAAVCMQAASCTGSTAACPAPAPVADGTACTGGSCVAGVCVPADAGAGDAGLDGSSDAASDAATDAATEGGADASTDAGADAARDSGSGNDSGSGSDSGAGNDSGSSGDDSGTSGNDAGFGFDAANEGGAGAGSGDSGGCGCKVAGERSSGNTWLFALAPLAVGLAFARRRKSARK